MSAKKIKVYWLNTIGPTGELYCLLYDNTGTATAVSFLQVGFMGLKMVGNTSSNRNMKIEQTE